MARFAPNLYHLFLELPVRERFAAVRAAGFDAIEWHFPYELPAPELRDLLQANGLALVNAVTPVDWRRDKGLAAQPGRQDEFRRSAAIALEYATTCGLRTLHPGAGTIPAGVAREACLDALRENLDWLCAQAAGTPLVVTIEGVCNARFPGCVLQTLDDALAVVREMDRPNLKLVWDSYHLRNEHKGSLLTLLQQAWPAIGHIQIGNVPGRHEPGVGDIDLHAVIREIDRSGWTGWIGLELDPSRDSWSSLQWCNAYGAHVGDKPAGVGGVLAPRPV